MTPFEYISVLISIILGIGITQLVSGVAEIIQQWDRNKIYWPHLLWIALIFFLHIQAWWQFYELQKYDEWQLYDFLIAAIYPINLFVLARLLFPHSQSENNIDYKKFYFLNFRKYFIWCIILIVVSIIDNFRVSHIPLREQFLQFGLLFIFFILTVKNLKQEWIHQLLVVSLLLIIVVALLVKDWSIRTH